MSNPFRVNWKANVFEVVQYPRKTSEIKATRCILLRNIDESDRPVHSEVLPMKNGYITGGNEPFLPLAEALASRVVTGIVSGADGQMQTDGRTGGKAFGTSYITQNGRR